jgi:nucleotide-binding universal stress UspA family protein
MVHFDGKPSSYRRLRLAIDLANRFRAVLIGLAGRSYLPSFLSSDNAGRHNQDEQQEMARVLAETGEKFRAAAKHVADVEWRGFPDDVTHIVVNEARAADLIIIGREKDSANPYYGLDPGAAIVGTGRPVLLVPDEIESLEAQHILIAWKDTREARRAVRDAIPFLQRAKRVTIVEVCEHASAAQSQRYINDLADYLSCHEVIVTGKVYLDSKEPVPNELFRFAGKENADLIVVGAYGHSRLGEWIFGGVTRDLIVNSPICTLLSH